MKYRLVAFIPLFVLMGCNKEHKAVVQNIARNEVFIKDLETNENKKLVMNTEYGHLEFVAPKDTVTFFATNCVYNHSALINIPADGYLMVDKDSLEIRQRRKYYKGTKYEKLVNLR